MTGSHFIFDWLDLGWDWSQLTVMKLFDPLVPFLDYVSSCLRFRL